MTITSKEAPDQAQPAPGPLGARVRVMRALAPGSSGETFLAETAGGPAVLKILDGGPDPEAQRTRILAEGEALRLGGCRGVVEYDEVVAEGERLYLVRPYVAGESLAAVYAARRPSLIEAL